MILAPQHWHERFIKQANWTRPLRQYFFTQAKSSDFRNVLEVGCGSGAILSDITNYTNAKIYGLDINEHYLTMAMRNIPRAMLVHADAHQLPFQGSLFDTCICHFLLLWVHNPDTVVSEMVRVTRPGGYVCALVEPDYGARIDFPEELMSLGQDQLQALLKQGANPCLGRQLRSLFADKGLVNVVAGVMGGQWQMPFDQEEWKSEWEVLESDLEINIETNPTYQAYKLRDYQAWTSGERILYVPTFFAWGMVPD